MNEKEFAELAAGHALSALSPDDERAYEIALAEHPEWQALVHDDAEVAASLADGVAEVAPPLTLRSELMRRIATLPQGEAAAPFDEAREPEQAQIPPLPPIPADVAAALPPEIIAAQTARAEQPAPGEKATDAAPEPPLDTMALQSITRRTWTRGLFALAASFVLLLGLGFGAVLIGQQINQPVAVSALNEIERAPDAQSATVAVADGGVATAHWAASVGKAVVVTDGLPSIANDKSYELWFVRDGNPVAAGVFTAAPAGDATALLEGEMHAGDTIAVTVEQAGGSPDGKPTTDPIFAIPTA